MNAKKVISLVVLAIFMLVLFVYLTKTNDNLRGYELSQTEYTILSNIHDDRVQWDNVYCVRNAEHYDAGVMFFDKNNIIREQIGLKYLQQPYRNSQAIVKLKKIDVLCEIHKNESVDVLELMDAIPIKWFNAKESDDRLIVEITNPLDIELEDVSVAPGYMFETQTRSIKPHETKTFEWDLNSYCKQSGGNLQIFITSNSYSRNGNIEDIPIGKIIVYADFDISIMC